MVFILAQLHFQFMQIILQPMDIAELLTLCSTVSGTATRVIIQLHTLNRTIASATTSIQNIISQVSAIKSTINNISGRLEQCTYESALADDCKRDLRGSIENAETLVNTIHDDLLQLVATTRSSPGPDRLTLSLWNLEAAEDYRQLLIGQVQSIDASLQDIDRSVMTKRGERSPSVRESISTNRDTSRERIFPFDEEILDSPAYRHARTPSQSDRALMHFSPRQLATQPYGPEDVPKMQSTRVDSLRDTFVEFSPEQLPQVVVEDLPEVFLDSASIRAPIPVHDSDQSPSPTTKPKWGPGSIGAYKNEDDYLAGLVAFVKSQESSDIGTNQLEGWYGPSAADYIANGQRQHSKHRRTTSEPDPESVSLSPTRPSGLRTKSESGSAMKSRISRLWQRRPTSRASQIIEELL